MMRASATSARWTLFLRIGRDVAHVCSAILACLLHVRLALGHALDEGFTAAGACLEFGFGNFIHDPGLADREDVLGGPIEREG